MARRKKRGSKVSRLGRKTINRSERRSRVGRKGRGTRKTRGSRRKKKNKISRNTRRRRKNTRRIRNKMVKSGGATSEAAVAWGLIKHTRMLKAILCSKIKGNLAMGRSTSVPDFSRDGFYQEVDRIASTFMGNHEDVVSVFFDQHSTTKSGEQIFTAETYNSLCGVPSTISDAADTVDPEASGITATEKVDYGVWVEQAKAALNTRHSTPPHHRPLTGMYQHGETLLGWAYAEIEWTPKERDNPDEYISHLIKEKGAAAKSCGWHPEPQCQYSGPGFHPRISDIMLTDKAYDLDEIATTDPTGNKKVYFIDNGNGMGLIPCNDKGQPMYR
jgi:hypothetical protein